METRRQTRPNHQWNPDVSVAFYCKLRFTVAFPLLRAISANAIQFITDTTALANSTMIWYDPITMVHKTPFQRQVESTPKQCLAG